MRKLFGILREEVNGGRACVLVGIVADSGSVPRGAGAHMLVGAQGRICGTIGGGAVEYHCEQMALEVLRSKTPHIEHYRLRPNDVQDLGMVCGGDVLVHFRYVAPHDPWLVQLEDSLSVQSGFVYIFGGGHIAQALVPVLSATDFRCVVLEDREAFCRPELFRGATEARLIDNDRVADFVSISEEDYVVIMTRGHKDDQTIQAQVLNTPARYIGVIGSRRKSEVVLANLREMGFSERELGRIITPIGLAIGAETPEEIAVSIAAQLIQKRAEKA